MKEYLFTVVQSRLVSIKETTETKARKVLKEVMRDLRINGSEIVNKTYEGDAYVAPTLKDFIVARCEEIDPESSDSSFEWSEEE